MKKKYRIVSVILWLVVIVMAGVLTTIYILNKPTATAKSTTSAKVSLDDGEKSGTKDTGYATETCFAGDSFVPKSLFMYPYKKTDSYIMNKDYINTVTAAAGKKEAQNVQTALETMFTGNYKSMDMASYQNALDQYFMVTNILSNSKLDIYADGSESISQEMVNLYKDEQLSIEAKAYSDKCLIFYDEGFDIVRSKLTLVVYECKDLEKIKKMFNVKNIEIGKPFSVIVDSYYTPNVQTDAHDTYKCAGFKIIKDLSSSK